MDIILKKTADGLIPVNEAGQDFLDTMKLGEMREFKTSKKRMSQGEKAFHSFLDFVVKNQERFKDKDSLLNWACMVSGYGSWMPFQDPKTGEKLLMFTRNSFRHRDADQNTFYNASEGVYQAIFNEMGISFHDWIEHVSEGKCAHPDCNRPATEKHHIFPGHGRRQLCDKHGFVINICHYHHRQSHEPGTMTTLQKLWCKLIKVDYEKAKKIIFS